MDALSAISLPPGFGFHPTDVELISHYLKKKILGQKIDFEIIPEVDIYKHEPWDLPAKCHVPTRDSKWHFFTSHDKKYPNGSRSNRATKAGYWKSTGKDRNIKFHQRVIGTKKTLVFHEGRPPHGKRTDWIMHEYHIDENECKAAPEMKDIFVLCRVTKRNGWALEGEMTQTEEAGNFQEQPKDTVGSMLCEETSSPSDTVKDFEAWFSELFDPDFSGIPSIDELNNETKVDPSSLAPKQEPVESCLQLAGVDDFLLPDDISGILQYGCDNFQDDFLLPDDISRILQSGSDNYLDMFGGELNIGTMDAAPVLQDNAGIASDELYPTVSSFGYESARKENENIDTGIQIRQRRAKPSTEISIHRIKLQVHKMESRNTGPLNQTIKLVNKDHHLSMNDGHNRHPSGAESGTVSDSKGSESGHLCRTASKTPQKRSADPVGCQGVSGALVDEVSCIQGVIRGLNMFLHGCSSAGLNCLIFGACMVGTAVLILYFLLRDARRFLASYNSIGL